MRAHPAVTRIAFVKGGWAVVGGALLLLTVFGDTRLPHRRQQRRRHRHSRTRRAASARRSVRLRSRCSSGGPAAASPGGLRPHISRRDLAYATLGFAPTIWLAATTVIVAAHFRVRLVGVEQRAAADGGSGSVSRTRLRGGVDCAVAGAVAVHDPDRGRARFLARLAARAGGRDRPVVDRGRVCFPQACTAEGQASPGRLTLRGLSPTCANLWKTDPSPIVSSQV